MEFWHWLALAAAFAVIEIAAPAMVCIWLAAAALGTAVIVWLAPGIAWETSGAHICGPGHCQRGDRPVSLYSHSRAIEQAPSQPSRRDQLGSDIHPRPPDRGWPRAA